MSTAFVRLTKARSNEEFNKHVYMAIQHIVSIATYKDGDTVVISLVNEEEWEVAESISEVMERINHVKSLEKS